MSLRLSCPLRVTILRNRRSLAGQWLQGRRENSEPEKPGLEEANVVIFVALRACARTDPAA